LTDESWALTTVEFESGAVDAAFLCGAGLVLYGSWVASTALGGITGAAIRHPEAWGLDFAFVGAFIALLSSLARERSVLFPWTLAAGVAVAAHHWLPGNWYVLLGGMSGSVPRLLRALRE
jgi:predicted branched-subunit amino acid permease